MQVTTPALRGFKQQSYDGDIVEGSQVEDEVLTKATSWLIPQTSFDSLFLL